MSIRFIQTRLQRTFYPLRSILLKFINSFKIITGNAFLSGFFNLTSKIPIFSLKYTKWWQQSPSACSHSIFPIKSDPSASSWIRVLLKIGFFPNLYMPTVKAKLGQYLTWWMFVNWGHMKTKFTALLSVDECGLLK